VTSHDDDTGERVSRLATDSSRRRFIAGSAAAFGGLALGGATPAFAGDDEDDEEMPEPGTVPPEAVENEFDDDVEILNYALLLEYLEAEFYEEGLDNIDESEFCDTDPIAEFGDPIQDRAYDDLETIRDHERNHAETLSAVIEDVGGEPIDEPEFEFGEAVEEPAAFIATGAVLEDVGVSAYAGAAPYIESDGLVAPALSIHSVEARHASFLRVLDDQIGFPVPYDVPRSRSEVEELASDFIVDDMDDAMEDD